MNMKRMSLPLVAAVFLLSTAIAASAAGNDPSEKGVPTSPLKIHSFGAGLGAMYAVNEEFQNECGDAFFGASLNHSWRFMENAALFVDMNWFYGDGAKNGGGELGVDYFFLTSQFSPFAGAGIGGHYFYREYSAKDNSVVPAEFSHKFGPSVVAHAGFELRITETAALRMRVPYRLMIVKDGPDHGVGVEVGVMFSSRLAKVKKLNY